MPQLDQCLIVVFNATVDIRESKCNDTVHVTHMSCSRLSSVPMNAFPQHHGRTTIELFRVRKPNAVDNSKALNTKMASKHIFFLTLLCISSTGCPRALLY